MSASALLARYFLSLSLAKSAVINCVVQIIHRKVSLPFGARNFARSNGSAIHSVRSRWSANHSIVTLSLNDLSGSKHLA